MKKIVLILQILLGLWSITGAWYMMGHYTELGSVWALATLPALFWIGWGIMQIVFALTLLISVWERFRRFAVPAATGLAGISLIGSVLYSAYAGFPGILWSLIPAAFFAFVAYTHKH